MIVQIWISILPAPSLDGVTLLGFHGRIKTSWGIVMRYVTDEDVGRPFPVEENARIDPGSWIDVRIGEWNVRIEARGDQPEQFVVSFNVVDPTEDDTEALYNVYRCRHILGPDRPTEPVEIVSEYGPD